MSKKYIIIPVSDKIAEIHAETAEDALVTFATGMDSDMGAYFRAVTEKEYNKLRNEFRAKEHELFVIDWMQSVVINDFAEIPEKDARTCAEFAYEVYCRGDGDTEYEAVERAVEEWLQESTKQQTGRN